MTALNIAPLPLKFTPRISYPTADSDRSITIGQPHPSLSVRRPNTILGGQDHRLIMILICSRDQIYIVVTC